MQITLSKYCFQIFNWTKCSNISCKWTKCSDVHSNEQNVQNIIQMNKCSNTTNEQNVMNGIECHLLSKKYQMIYYSNLEQSQRQVLGLQQTFVQCGKCNDTKRGFFAMSCRCLPGPLNSVFSTLAIFCLLWLFWC